jgi:lipid II:glycine glycyltransferase (peptidoglycan interpeptide bridge formation enzyme)
MFSDSVFQIIENLLNEIRHYHRDPFNYSLDYYDELKEALANLYKILNKLDLKDELANLEYCRRIAEEELERIRYEENTSPGKRRKM